MHRIPALLTGCVLAGAIALGTALAWMALTGSRVLSLGAVIVCTGVSVVGALGVEQVIHRARHGRPRRAHAKTRKPTA